MDSLDRPGTLMAFTKNCAIPLVLFHSGVCWCVAQTPSWAAFSEGTIYKMHFYFYFLTLNFDHFKMNFGKKNKWKIAERKVRTWAGLDTVMWLRTFLLCWLKTSHEMLRLKCLLISVHNQCDIVCTIHLILNWFSLLLVLSHVTFVSCGKKSLLFFKQRHFIGQKSLFF